MFSILSNYDILLHWFFKLPKSLYEWCTTFLKSSHDSPSSFRKCSCRSEFNRTSRTVRHGGGIVKLLLRCLQSIQCQYYLVFGVVKTVPFCNLSRDCNTSPTFHFSPSLFSHISASPKNVFATFSLRLKRLNNMANGHRYIYIYILHLLSLRSSLITYTACARACFALIRFPFHLLRVQSREFLSQYNSTTNI